MNRQRRVWEQLQTWSPRPAPGEDIHVRLTDDFLFFCFCLWMELRLPAPTRRQMAIALYLANGPRRRMVQAFRGVGKSWLTAAYVLWRLYRNPNERILVVSASKDRADAFSVFVKRLIDEVPWLQFLRPDPMKQHRDSLVAFDVGPSSPHQAPSVRSVGITGQITGSRASVIVADDVEVPKNSMTVTMRDQLAKAVAEFDAVLMAESDLTSIGLERADVIYLGTPQTVMSLYNSLPSRGYEVRVWPARYPKPEQMAAYGSALADEMQAELQFNPALAGTPSEPSRFPEQDLLNREASYGRSGFALQFMLDTTLSDANRYPLKMADLMIMDLDPRIAPAKLAWGSGPEQRINDIPCVGLPGDRLHSPLYVDKAFTEYQGSVMSIDPSGRGGDETGYAVVNMLHGMLFTMALGGFKGGYDRDTLLGLAGIAKRFHVKRVVIEANFGDGMFVQLFKPVLQEVGYPCEVEEIRSTQAVKDARIIDVLEPVLNQHRMVLNRQVLLDDAKTEPQDYSAFFQMTRISRDKGSIRRYDRVDAWSMAVADWVTVLDVDNRQASDRYREDALRRELEEFESGVLGGAIASGDNWMRNMIMPNINGFGRL